MKNSLLDRLKGKISRGVGVGLVGLSSLVSGCIHTTPQEAARLILKPTLTGNFDDWNKDGEVTKIGNSQGNQSQGQDQSLNNVQQTLDNDNCYIFAYEGGQKIGLVNLDEAEKNRNFNRNQPLVFLLTTNNRKSGQVKLYVLNKETGKDVFEKYIGIKALENNNFVEKTNSNIFAPYGSHFECYWKIGDEIIASSSFSIE